MHKVVRFFLKTHVIMALFFIFLLSVFIFQWKQIVLNARKERAIQQAQAVQATPAPTKFDINGSYICKEGSRSAVLSKKRFFKEDKTATGSAYLLFDGDCGYTWRQVRGKNIPGEKSCGYSQYVSMIEMLSKFGGAINADSLLKSAGSTKDFEKMLPASQSAMIEQGMKLLSGSFIKSCQKVESVPEKLFNAPGGITFTEPKKNK